MLKDLQTCREEVFRRSARRIEERKNLRRRILTGCLPVVLLAALLWAAEPPEQTNGTLTVPGGVNAQSGSPVRTYAYAQAEIQEGKLYTSIKVEDAARVAQIYGAILAVQPDGASGVPESVPEIGMTGGSGGVRVILYTAEGERNVYRLTEDTLFWETGGEWYPLTKKQYSQIRQALSG